MCRRCCASYYGETDRHLKVRSGENIGISPVTFRKNKPSKESAIRDHLLICNNMPSFDKFTILLCEYLWVNMFLKSKKACVLSVIGLS